MQHFLVTGKVTRAINTKSNPNCETNYFPQLLYLVRCDKLSYVCPSSSHGRKKRFVLLYRDASNNSSKNDVEIGPTLAKKPKTLMEFACSQTL